MRQSLVFAATLLLAAVPLTAGAQAPAESGQKTQAQPSTPSSGSATGQGIKEDAKQAKQNIKADAAEVKKNIKSGAAQVKRKLAVAQCNDGQYSYTHHKTCNEHGGIGTRLRE